MTPTFRAASVEAASCIAARTFVALLIGSATAFAQALPDVGSYGERVIVKKDIAFGTGPVRVLDLYLPKGDGPFPLVVCFYGGGFTGGNKQGMSRMCAYLASKGFAAAAPNYTLADPKTKAPAFPACLNDAKAAVRFLRVRAKDHRVDPNRIAVLGHSAGAYLALMVGFTAGCKDLEEAGEGSTAVSAVVNISGVTDRREGLGTGTKFLLGEGYENKPELRSLASPVVHAKTGVPVYTLHGEDDKTVVPDSARRLDEAMRKAGVEHVPALVPKLGHNPINTATMEPAVEWLRGKLK